MLKIFIVVSEGYLLLRQTVVQEFYVFNISCRFARYSLLEETPAIRTKVKGVLANSMQIKFVLKQLFVGLNDKPASRAYLCIPLQIVIILFICYNKNKWILAVKVRHYIFFVVIRDDIYVTGFELFIVSHGLRRDQNKYLWSTGQILVVCSHCVRKWVVFYLVGPQMIFEDTVIVKVEVIIKNEIFHAIVQLLLHRLQSFLVFSV